MRRLTTATQPSGTLSRFLSPLVLLALMWVVQFADAILPGSFSKWGIRSWDPSGLLGILFAPLLHSGWPHLIGNSIPFLVLGCIVAAEGARRFWAVTGVIAVIGGLGTWIVNTPGTLTVGASGRVFGYFGYLVARVFAPGRVSHRILYAVIALIVIGVYGGTMLAGVFGVSAGISWQGHLFGAVGGALAAFVGRGRSGDRRAS